MSDKKFVRTKIIVNKKFQYKMLLLFLIPFLIMNIVMFYCLSMSFSSLLIQNVSKEIENDLITFKNKIYIIATCGSLLIINVMFPIVLLFSHRIAGPMFKLHRKLVAFNAGSAPEKIYFRKKDFFKNFVTDFNRFLEKYV